MPTAYVYPTLDDEPIVPIVTTSQTNNNTTNEQSTNKSYTSTTAMDPTITAATTQRRKEIPISEDDKEELELDYLENKKESSIGNDNDTSSYQPETLRREDLGNFILLVILCKLIIFKKKSLPFIISSSFQLNN